MLDIRNSDGHLVAKVDVATGAIEIKRKGCVTLIKREIDGKVEIANSKECDMSISSGTHIFCKKITKE